ncbi:hypothetical protein EBX31_07340 [bacterium]|nr:hypothetical protein [bacterium]
MSQPTKSDSANWQACNWERQVKELQAQAEKRFWVLVPVENGARFEVQDQLGCILHGPDFFPGLRGFFEKQPAQA